MTKKATNNVSLEIKEIVSNYIKERKMTKIPLVELAVDIDFDEASRAWHENKKKLNDCTYKYICVHCSITGRKCGRAPLANSNYCKPHTK
jgi:hypothetical protein